LGLDRESDPSRTQDWISYRTGEDWPQAPPGARNIIQRDLYVPKPSGPQMQVNEDGNNGYYLPPQGRLSPDTISLLRPAPNGFAYAPPEMLLLSGREKRQFDLSYLAKPLGARQCIRG
jgi:hypothetical protein